MLGAKVCLSWLENSTGSGTVNSRSTASVNATQEVALFRDCELLAAPTALTRHHAYKWAWYDEPARWLFGCDVEEQFSDVCVLPPVNTVRTDIEWTPDGTCSVAPGTTAEADHRITMYEGTRWTVVTDEPETNPASSPGVVPCGEEVITST